MSGHPDGEGITWRANTGWFTHARAHIPWLRPDSKLLHMIRSGLEDEIENALTASGYTCLRLNGERIAGRRELIERSKALMKLWDYCGSGWDSWRDCLSDLNDIWSDTDRLALLWTRSDVLVRADLQSWAVSIEILRETSQFLGTKPLLRPDGKMHPDAVPHRLMVFETFCFVEGLRAQEPV
jgi:hypothetical protein